MAEPQTLMTKIAMTAAAMLAVAGLGLAAPAQASEQGYLDDMSSLFGPVSNPQQALKTGYQACRLLNKGYSDQQIIEITVASLQMSRGDVGNIIASARDQLC